MGNIRISYVIFAFLGYCFGVWTVLVLLPPNCAMALFYGGSHPACESDHAVKNVKHPAKSNLRPPEITPKPASRGDPANAAPEAASKYILTRKLDTFPEAGQFKTDWRKEPDIDQHVARIPVPFEPRPVSSYKATVIVTVECLAYHNWQSVMVIYSLEKIRAKYNQNFNIVRIVSCYRADSKVMQSLSESLRSDPWSPHPITNYLFPTMNKPAALKAWMDGNGKELPEDHEVIITDPDFMFLAPLPLGLSEMGKPASAHYLYGAGWTHQENVWKHCWTSKCQEVTDKIVEDNYTTGPPYVLRMRDFRKIVPHWFNITNEMVLEGDPKKAWGVPGEWLADMFAYNMGAIMEGLPHKIRDELFVSMAGEGEWEHMKDTGVTKPMGIHFCQNYNITTTHPNHSLQFNKHDWHERTDITFLSCDPDKFTKVWGHDGFNPPPEVLTDEEPDALPLMQWSMDRGGAADAPPLKEMLKKRNEWMWWQIYHGFNDIFGRFRKEFC